MLGCSSLGAGKAHQGTFALRALGIQGPSGGLLRDQLSILLEPRGLYPQGKQDWWQVPQPCPEHGETEGKACSREAGTGWPLSQVT